MKKNNNFSRKDLEEKIFTVRSAITDLVVKKEELEKLLEHKNLIDERIKITISANIYIVEKEINNRKSYLRKLKQVMNKIKNNNKKKIKNNKNKNKDKDKKPDVNRLVIEKMEKIMEEVKNVIKPSPFKKQKEPGKAPVKNRRPQTMKGTYRPFECLRELLV